MTSSNGYRVIKTTCCGAKFSSPAYMSINYSCWEFWTDGRAVKSLAPQDGGLLKCVCGNFFLYRQAESGPVIYNPLPPPPENWESEEVWSGFLKGGQSKRDYLLAEYDFRSEFEREQERLAKPPEEIVVKDEELLDLFASGCSNNEVLMVARRRYWRFLNDEYRKSYRKHIKLNPDTFPIFSPTELQRNNMLQLIQLIEIEDNPDYLELAELHRQLGNFEAAFEVIATKYQENEKQQELGDVIANLIFYNKNQPQIVNRVETFVKKENIEIRKNNDLTFTGIEKLSSISFKIAMYIRWIDLTFDRGVAMDEVLDLIDKISSDNQEIQKIKIEIMSAAYRLLDDPEIEMRLQSMDSTTSIEKFCALIDIPVPNIKIQPRHIY